MSIASLYHGGAERVVASLCNNLDKDRFAVSVCWRMGPGVIGEELMAQGFELINLAELAPGVSAYRRFLVLKQLLKQRNIDILHTHDTGALADGAQCRLLGTGTRLVHTFHYGNYPHLKKHYLLMETLFSRVAHRLVAVGCEQEASIRRALHLSPSRTQTIYNGVPQVNVDTDTDLVGRYRATAGNPVIIGSVSSLTDQKGLHHLLDAMDVLRRTDANCILLIGGDGPLRQPLEDQCRRLNLSDRVFFLGWVSHAAEQLISCVDIFCQPSLWEANSIVLLEAMAAGVAIVTTDVGESRHVIDNETTGLIVQPGNVQELASALRTLINDPSRRLRMGERARVKFSENYTVDRMISRYSELYENLM